MRVSAKHSHDWHEINNRVQEELVCKIPVKVSPGLHQALFQVGLSLSLLFPKKKKIVSQMGFGKHLSQLELWFARQGVSFKDVWTEEPLEGAKDTLAYIHDVDDALTAQMYNHLEVLRWINSSSTPIVCVHVVHHLFHFQRNFVNSLQDWDILVASISPNCALIFLGKALENLDLSLIFFPWSLSKDGDLILKVLRENRVQDKKRVLDFESSLPKDIHPWFESDSSRIYDRSVVCLENMDAFSFMELWSEKKETPLSSPGFSSLFEVASPYRWNHEDWLALPKGSTRSLKDVQELLCIDLQVLEEEFMESFHQIIMEVKSLST